MSTVPSPARPSELVSGFLAVLSMVGSLLAIVYQPVKVTPFALLLALIATGMGPKSARLPLAAVFLGAACFLVGMTIAVVTNHALY